MIFETERLQVKKFSLADKTYFDELLTDPRIIDLGPHQQVDMELVEERFRINLEPGTIPKKNQDNIWGVFIKGNPEMIGLAAILTNTEGDWELGYRFRVFYWGKGYGTELAIGMTNHCFEVLNFNKLTADVDIENLASVKILEKIMVKIDEFYNEEDRCIDRRYAVLKSDWTTSLPN